jgi:integrase
MVDGGHLAVPARLAAPARTACEAASVRTTPYDGRHTYASLLIHEGRSLPYVTAALGHASATTTLNHYAHVVDEARLATGAPMIEAVETARALMEARGVYPVCTRDPIRVLRSAPKAARTA